MHSASINLGCDSSLGRNYLSASQRARVISEGWLAREGYCLECSADSLLRMPNNSASRDFFCNACQHPYELKSFRRPVSHKIVDGAFGSMMGRIEAGTVPTLFLLQYDDAWSVVRLTAIHRSFLIPSAIEARKPLSAAARRAGWTGCNILLDRIPAEARISLVERGEAFPGSRCAPDSGRWAGFQPCLLNRGAGPLLCSA